MAQQRRVIFLNRFFYPDHSPTSELLSDLAFALAERGFEVSVVTSRQRYDAAQADLAERETVRGVDIKRVWTSRRGAGVLQTGVLCTTEWSVKPRRVLHLGDAGCRLKPLSPSPGFACSNAFWLNSPREWPTLCFGS